MRRVARAHGAGFCFNEVVVDRLVLQKGKLKKRFRKLATKLDKNAAGKGLLPKLIGKPKALEPLFLEWLQAEQQPFEWGFNEWLDTGAAIETAVSITEKGSKNMEGGLAQVKVSGEKLGELSTIVKDNAAAVRQIAAAVNQQNAGITQIASAVEELNQHMDATVRRLTATNASVDGLRQVSLRVTDVVDSFRVD